MTSPTPPTPNAIPLNPPADPVTRHPPLWYRGEFRRRGDRRWRHLCSGGRVDVVFGLLLAVTAKEHGDRRVNEVDLTRAARVAILADDAASQLSRHLTTLISAAERRVP